ncbi:MAG: hypothetical protein ACFCVK_17125 [Acidimicrobiales bacterium]
MTGSSHQGGRHTTTPSRGRIVVTELPPTVEWTAVASRSALTVLAVTFVTALTLSLLSLAATPVGWAIVAASTLSGLVPILHHLLRGRRTTSLPTWSLTPGLAATVAGAAARAAQLRSLAERSPDGPVADHLTHLADTADTYVVALHGAAAGAAASEGDGGLEAEMMAVVGRLDELVEAAERLRRAQKRYLERSPLDELIDATDHLTEVIEAEATRPNRATMR